MILGLQLVAIIFALTMIYLAVLNYRRNEIDKMELISWILIWTLTVVVVIFPEILRVFSRRFFITRLFDMMVVGGFILVIFMVAKTYVRSRKMEKKLEELIRKDALKNAKKDK